MSKKAKKAARELQRLQNLYQRANTSAPIGVSQNVAHHAAVSGGSAGAVTSHSHAHVKRDLVMLFILLVVMVAGLIGLNLLAESTAFGTMLASWVGKIF